MSLLALLLALFPSEKDGSPKFPEEEELFNIVSEEELKDLPKACRFMKQFYEVGMIRKKLEGIKILLEYPEDMNYLMDHLMVPLQL